MHLQLFSTLKIAIVAHFGFDVMEYIIKYIIVKIIL